MAKVTLLLCALLIVALIQGGKGREAYGWNYSEMVGGIKHPGLISALKAYDTDKDGIISGEENTVMAEKAAVFFNHSDANEDGQLNPQELQQFVHQMTNLRVDKVFSEQEQEQMFSNLDIDRNGALSQDEMDEPKLVEVILKAFAN